ncbi:hypothetical protein HMPREF1008_00878 [Olsenella sp. oral taxon 809 str. F0356]|uniref:phage tail spike protein n=1 Tax=Olsenella sp. oral taxon 809 TaxID=661086 RepID=UPI000231ED03|nr:phage tail spike protein [Olsenella sp. oral taxon 809]EHF02172.1 hypothetical protein HMPREF1008_00878 [Olsenella sp. oral taxon 809 str. F0356]
MAGAVPELFWFDRWDERIGILTPTGEVTHTEELGGEDTIEFDSWDVPGKGDWLVWYDDSDDCWREHVVVRTDEPLEGMCHVYCESSLCELLDDFVEDTVLTNATASAALAAILAPTRWTAGTVADLGNAGCWFYHTNALAALRRIADVWKGEVATTIAVTDGRVSSRQIFPLSQVGAWHGARFTYGKNLAGCKRTVLEDEVFTALYGFGAGLPITDDQGRWTGGYRRKLTFGDVNRGVNWVGDDDARLVWGRWNAERTEKVHSFGQVTFSDCDDQNELLALTQAALVDACQPKVSYEVDVALLDGGVPVGLGDTVAVIDSSRDPEWRLTARVLKRVRVFSDAVTTHVILGTIQKASYAITSALSERVTAVEDVAATTSESVASISSAVTVDAGGSVETIATQTYVDDAIANLDDLSGTEF